MHRLIALMLFAATEALAHPQHAEGAWSAPLAHLLSEPDHVLLLVVPALVAAIFLARFVMHHARSRVRGQRNRAL